MDNNNSKKKKHRKIMVTTNTKTPKRMDGIINTKESNPTNHQHYLYLLSPSNNNNNNTKTNSLWFHTKYFYSSQTFCEKLGSLVYLMWWNGRNKVLQELIWIPKN